MIVWLYHRLFIVSFDNISLIWSHHHCRWRATKFRPLLRGYIWPLSIEGSVSCYMYTCCDIELLYSWSVHVPVHWNYCFFRGSLENLGPVSKLVWRVLAYQQQISLNKWNNEMLNITQLINYRVQKNKGICHVHVIVLKYVCLVVILFVLKL